MALHFRDEDFGIRDEFPLGIVRHLDHRDKELHTHDFAELVIVFHGSTVHFTTEQESPLKPGDVFFVPKGAQHGYRHSNNLTLVNVMYDPDRLRLPDSDLRSLPGYHAFFLLGHKFQKDMKPLHLPQPKLDEIARIIESIEDEIRHSSPGYMAMALAQLSQLIVSLSRTYSSELTPPQEGSELRIADAMAYVETHLDQEVSIPKLMKLTNLSESSLLRAFKKTVQMGPLEFHLHQRIRRSCRLLRKSDLSVTEIGFRVGFNDSNYFSRQFKKRMNMTPTEYRKILSRGP
jgi:AraC-like DNA-binding protein